MSTNPLRGVQLLLLSVILPGCRIPGWGETGDTGVMSESGVTGDSGETSSGSGDSHVESRGTETGDSGSGSGGSTTDPADLTCDGAMDDGSAIKLCGSDFRYYFGQWGIIENSDLSGDGAPDLLVLGPTTAVLDISDIATSHIVDRTEGQLVGPDSGHIFLSAFGQGDRDGDGQDDLLIEDKWSSGGSQGQILVFDGPVVAGTTSDDAEAVLGYSSTHHEGPGPAVWVSGLGTGGGDGVLYGSTYNTDGTSLARFVADPVGTISADDVTATYSVGSSDDYTVGRSVQSADLDGDGVAELIIGVTDYSTDMEGGEVVLAQAETGALDLDDYPSVQADYKSGGSLGHYAVWGWNFTTGDADDDGYEDLVVNLSPRSGWSDTGHTVTALYYGPTTGDRAGYADAFIEETDYADANYMDATFPGDISGDGLSGDLVLTLADAYLFADPPSGHLTLDDATERLELATLIDNSFSVGDVNGDGVGDLACVATGDDEVATDSGAVFLLFGPV